MRFLFISIAFSMCFSVRQPDFHIDNMQPEINKAYSLILSKIVNLHDANVKTPKDKYKAQIEQLKEYLSKLFFVNIQSMAYSCTYANFKSEKQLEKLHNDALAYYVNSLKVVNLTPSKSVETINEYVQMIDVEQLTMLNDVFSFAESNLAKRLATIQDNTLPFVRNAENNTQNNTQSDDTTQLENKLKEFESGTRPRELSDLLHVILNENAITATSYNGYKILFEQALLGVCKWMADTCAFLNINKHSEYKIAKIDENALLKKGDEIIASEYLSVSHKEIVEELYSDNLYTYAKNFVKKAFYRLYLKTSWFEKMIGIIQIIIIINLFVIIFFLGRYVLYSYILS